MNEHPKPSHRLKNSGTVVVRKKAVPWARALLSGEMAADVAKAVHMNVHTAAIDRTLNLAIPHCETSQQGIRGELPCLNRQHESSSFEQ